MTIPRLTSLVEYRERSKKPKKKELSPFEMDSFVAATQNLNARPTAPGESRWLTLTKK